MKNNKRAAILVVSFGTTHLDTLERCIAATENAIAAHFPQHPVYRAFTSRTVIRRLKERQGICVDTVSEALARIAADGFNCVAVQPTLILAGIEYEGLLRTLNKEPGLRIAVGKPLVANAKGCEAMASLIMEENPLAQDEALLLMGHGTEHEANEVYHAIQEFFDAKGYRGFIGTVEGTPSFADATVRLKDSGAAHAKLLPLMFVAGDHAKNDMAGEQEGSLLMHARTTGVLAEPILRGLGESEKVREFYVQRTQEALEEVLA
jgi:sirohydrochlorin cobaltochelatase